jgi:hypothetical protein
MARPSPHQLKKPEVNSFGQKELDKAEKQFESFDNEVKALSSAPLNELPNALPIQETEQQTKLSSRQVAASQDIYLKPKRRVSGREKFNERFRAAYEYDKEYIRVIMEHKELIGETIPCWTKPYAGVPAEEWEIPTNKPIFVPRYLAEQIKRKFYRRLKMNEGTPVETDAYGTYQGQLVGECLVQRLDCNTAPDRKTLAIGSRNF